MMYYFPWRHGGKSTDYFLLNSFLLGMAAGPGPNKTSDVGVGEALQLVQVVRDLEHHSPLRDPSLVDDGTIAHVRRASRSAMPAFAWLSFPSIQTRRSWDSRGCKHLSAWFGGKPMADFIEVITRG